MAESRLCALAMAWKSPVKCRLMSSMGTTWAYPPPAAPPFTPNTGPSDGSRMQSAAFFPSLRSAWVTPTVTVDLPSPAGVGLMPVTSTSRPFGLRRARAWSRIFALYLPYSSTSSSPRLNSAAMSATGRSLAACAMAMSVGTFTVVVTDPLALERGVEPRAEHPAGVVRCSSGQILERLAARARERRGHGAHERRLVALAAMRHRRQVRRVGLDEEAVRRNVGKMERAHPALECDHTRERKVRADPHPRFEHRRAGAERVQHDRHADAGEQGRDVGVRRAGVHHHRLVQFRSE